jgi:hypothetical protein
MNEKLDILNNYVCQVKVCFVVVIGSGPENIAIYKLEMGIHLVVIELYNSLCPCVRAHAPLGIGIGSTENKNKCPPTNIHLKPTLLLE